MTTTVSPQSPSFTAPFIDLVQQNPRITACTAAAFAALGIAASAGASLLVASVPLAVILAIASVVALSTSAILSYFAVQNAFASRTNGTTANRTDLVDVMKETLTDLKAGFYTAPDGTLHNFDLSRAISGASLLRSAGAVFQRPGAERTQLVVKNLDCLYAAKELHDKGLNPLVLDMASDGHFGGGYMQGARAQEEDCCRRSGLCMAADTQHGLQSRNFYPLSSQSTSAGLYVPHVPVFRAANDKGYQNLDQPFEVGFGIVAAFNSPSLDYSTGRPRLRENDAAMTREKIRSFFEMAYRNGHKSVVFGALGCGAFRNPPEHIAQLAVDVINREFAHCFKEIVIAVRDDHNAGLSHNPQGNFVPFARQALLHGGKAFDANGQELTIF